MARLAGFGNAGLVGIDFVQGAIPDRRHVGHHYVCPTLQAQLAAALGIDRGQGRGAGDVRLGAGQPRQRNHFQDQAFVGGWGAQGGGQERHGGPGAGDGGRRRRRRRCCACPSTWPRSPTRATRPTSRPLSPTPFLRQRRVGMGDVRADADHIEVQLAEEKNIGGDAGQRLAGDADHDAAADFIAQRAELL